MPFKTLHKRKKLSEAERSPHFSDPVVQRDIHQSLFNISAKCVKITFDINWQIQKLFFPKKIWKKLFGTIAELKNICVIYNWLFYIYFITKIYYYFFAYALLSSFSFQNGCLANIMFDLCHAELFPPKIYFKAAVFQQNERHTKSMCLNLKNVCFH